MAPPVVSSKNEIRFWFHFLGYAASYGHNENLKESAASYGHNLEEYEMIWKNLEILK